MGRYRGGHQGDHTDNVRNQAAEHGLRVCRRRPGWTPRPVHRQLHQLRSKDRAAAYPATLPVCGAAATFCSTARETETSGVFRQRAAFSRRPAAMAWELSPQTSTTTAGPISTWPTTRLPLNPPAAGAIHPSEPRRTARSIATPPAEPIGLPGRQPAQLPHRLRNGRRGGGRIGGSIEGQRHPEAEAQFARPRAAPAPRPQLPQPSQPNRNHG